MKINKLMVLFCLIFPVSVMAEEIITYTEVDSETSVVKIKTINPEVPNNFSSHQQLKGYAINIEIEDINDLQCVLHIDNKKNVVKSKCW